MPGCRAPGHAPRAPCASSPSPPAPGPASRRASRQPTSSRLQPQRGHRSLPQSYPPARMGSGPGRPRAEGCVCPARDRAAGRPPPPRLGPALEALAVCTCAPAAAAAAARKAAPDRGAHGRRGPHQGLSSLSLYPNWNCSSNRASEVCVLGSPRLQWRRRGGNAAGPHA